MKVGVLAIQGDVSEHVDAMRWALGKLAGGEVVRIKCAEQVDGCDALVLPGGESTTHTSRMWENGVAGALVGAHRRGVPILGTCTGLILLSRDGGEQARRTGQRLLGLLDVDVERNAYGRQANSFEAPLDLSVLGIPDFPGVFIRAPFITRVGPRVEVMGELNGGAVAVRWGGIWGLTFHPELTRDTRVHTSFLGEAMRKR